MPGRAVSSVCLEFPVLSECVGGPGRLSISLIITTGASEIAALGRWRLQPLPKRRTAGDMSGRADARWV